MNNNEWQPIETAPNDGKTVVLVYEFGYVNIGIFDKKGFCQDFYNTGLHPTHWMPLPDPPTQTINEKEILWKSDDGIIFTATNWNPLFTNLNKNK